MVSPIRKGAVVLVGFAIVVVLGLAALVLAVVAVGIGGQYQEKNPAFTDFAEKATRHLNGEAPPPAKLAELLKR